MVISSANKGWNGGIKDSGISSDVIMMLPTMTMRITVATNS